MASQVTNIWQIGKWRVEPALGRVSNESGDEFLRPREMDLLIYLAEQHGRIVSADDIMSDVWSGVEVTNDSLYFSISQLRKRLDEPGVEQSMIETMPKRGYRLTVAAAQLPDLDVAEATSSKDFDQRARETDPIRQLSGRHALYGVLGAILIVAAVGWFRSEPPPAELGSTNSSNSIAVMPLIDLSPDTDYTYFSDGITDEILNRLARVQGLLVAARTSSFAFKSSASSVAEIGDALGVGTILEGSVRKDGDRVRISVQLIDTETGFQLWSETYERELSSVFAIQNEISQQIASALQLALANDAQASEPTGEAPASDPRVVDEYLLGLEAFRTYSFDSIRQAIRHFENVLRDDPTFTQAFLQLADAKLALLDTGASYDMTLVDEAESLVHRALERDPESGTAYRVLAVISRWRGQWQQSREQVLRALELSPSDSIAMVKLGEIHMIHGEFAAAAQAFERALRIDPYGSAPLMRYASLKHDMGDLEEARSTIERAIELHPTNPNLPWKLGMMQVSALGDLAGGLENFLRSATLDTQDYEIAAYVAMTYLSLGMQDAALPWIARAKNDGPDTATSQAIEATYLQLTGEKSRATSIAITAIRDHDHRLYFHGLLSRNLLVIAVRNLLDDGRVDYAIQLLEDGLSHSATDPGAWRNVEVEGSMTEVQQFSDAWLVALAYAHSERGNAGKALELVKNFSVLRVGEIPEGQTAPRNEDYLLEAQVLAMLDMLEKAVQHNLIFGWQIQVAGDYAFRHLESNPRFVSLVDLIKNEVERQRDIVLARPVSAVARSQ
jgi:TolB-like protein/DNA-binding winged helix-turn-helix (wHTH) protein/Flp pilus assembly protein TadD